MNYNMNYKEFLNSKIQVAVPSGFECEKINDKLFDFQRDIVKWALKKGKAAIFAGTGLGKTFMQCEWAHRVVEHTGGRVLILAPLAVAAQTIKEAQKIDVDVRFVAEQSDVESGISITNYEKLEKFDLSVFDGVVLDESSILKSFTGKVKQKIIDSCASVPYKLACTATPAPNDYMELGNHAEFLGVMKRTEMLAMYFIHDGKDTAKWRLKGHAVKWFWEWVASWAVMLTNPRDLGYDGSRFDLPPLNIHEVVVHSEVHDSLFAVEALTLQERQAARRDSVDDRAKACAELIADSKESWLVWCNLNSESELLHKYIAGSVEVKGADSNEYKEKMLIGFSTGDVKRLVSKPVIAGYGMNWQCCSKMVFVGLSDSFEQYYQAVRRCWRFGQTKPVDVYIIIADTEGAVKANIERKERDFNEMLQGMISATQEITKANIEQTTRKTSDYIAEERMVLPRWVA